MAIAFLKQLLQSSKQAARQPDSGMTLLELLVVVIMVGILATTLGASWMGFTNRQRITRLNNAVQRSIEKAQIEAKTKKISYSVSFRESGGRPEVKMGAEDKGDGATNNITSAQWRLLAEGLDIKANQVTLDPSDETTITFDHEGALKSPEPEIYLVVSEKDNDTTKQCVIVETLLGGIRTDTGSDCSP